MKNERLFNLVAVLLVMALHLGAMGLLWRGQHKNWQEPVDVDNLTFVDLGSVQGNDKPLVLSVPLPQVPPPKQAVKPTVKPLMKKSVTRTEVKKVKAVLKETAKADVSHAVVEKKPKPKPIPVEPKAKKMPKPKEQKMDEALKDLAKSVQKMERRASVHDDTVKTHSANGANEHAHRHHEDSNGGGSDRNKVVNNGAGGQGTGSGKGAKSSENQPKRTHAGEIANGGYLTKPVGHYPRLSQENGEEGTVKVEVIVGAMGNIISARVLGSSGHPRLDKAGLATAQSASYRPKSVGGEAVKTRFVAVFHYKLDE